MSDNEFSIKSIIDLVLSDIKHRQSNLPTTELSSLEVACATRDAMPLISDKIYNDLAEKVLNIVLHSCRDADLYKEHPSIFSGNGGPIWWRKSHWPSHVCTGLSFETRNAINGYIGIFMPSRGCRKEQWIKDQYSLSGCVGNNTFKYIAMQNLSHELSLPAFPRFKYINEMQSGTSLNSLLMAAGLKPFQGDQSLADWIAEQTLAYAKSIDEALEQA